MAKVKNGQSQTTSCTNTSTNTSTRKEIGVSKTTKRLGYQGVCATNENSVSGPDGTSYLFNFTYVNVIKWV